MKKVITIEELLEYCSVYQKVVCPYFRQCAVFKGQCYAMSIHNMTDKIAFDL